MKRIIILNIFCVTLISNLFLSCKKENKDYGTINIRIGKFKKNVDMLTVEFEKNELYGDSIKIVDTIIINDAEINYQFKLNQPKTALFKLHKKNKEIGLITFQDKSNNDNYIANPLIGNEVLNISINKIDQHQKILTFRATIEGDKENEMFWKYFKSNKLITFDDVYFNPKSYSTLYKLCNQKSLIELNKLKQYSLLFDEQLKKSNAFISLSNYIKSKQNLLINGYSKDFNWLDINGKHYNFNQIKSEKKLTLLVFWASWCTPCRKEIPNLKKIHQSFKKDLNIISLSIDDDYKRWKKAVLQEQMPWINLSGLPNDKNGVERQYNITEVPTLILINQKGEIIERIYDLEKMVEIIEKNKE